jgi:hypothetical protein
VPGAAAPGPGLAPVAGACRRRPQAPRPALVPSGTAIGAEGQQRRTIGSFERRSWARRRAGDWDGGVGRDDDVRRSWAPRSMDSGGSASGGVGPRGAWTAEEAPARGRAAAAQVPYRIASMSRYSGKGTWVGPRYNTYKENSRNQTIQRRTVRYKTAWATTRRELSQPDSREGLR